MRTPNGRHLGRKPDRPDPRDPHFAGRHGGGFAASLPPACEFWQALPPAYDQSQSSSCGPNAAAGLMAVLFPGFLASRLQIYFDVRTLEGDVAADNGVETRNVIRTLQKWGAVPEADWPFDLAHLMDAPPPAIRGDQDQHRIDSISRLSTEGDFMTCLAAGFPFILGFEVPDYFDGADVARTGVVPMPGWRNPSFIGGHDVLAVGYDTNFKLNPDFIASGVDPALMTDQALLIRNSWGTAWGVPTKPGHFWLPTSWATNASTGGDAWTGRADASLPRAPQVAGVTIEGQFQTVKENA